MNTHRFAGRCPQCNKVVAMTKRRKADPHDLVTEWDGKCENDHVLYLKSDSAGVLPHGLVEIGWQEGNPKSHGRYLVLIDDKGSHGYSDPGKYEDVLTWNGRSWWETFQPEFGRCRVTHHMALPSRPEAG